MVWLADAALPEGLRLYAIGDVHGCLGALRSVHADIQADLARRPVADWRVIHVGDYIDRGPEIRAVLDYLISCQADPRMIFLMGNHDKTLIDALAGDTTRFPRWTTYGGTETLAEYGIDAGLARDPTGLGAALRSAVPRAHHDFLTALPYQARFGDYLFVHAGIEPSRPLTAQDEDTLIWIRDPFLLSDQEFEAVVVHGHTPVHEVDVRSNRIGIDTGAVFGRMLSCLVLEGRTQALLSENGPVPL